MKFIKIVINYETPRKYREIRFTKENLDQSFNYRVLQIKDKCENVIKLKVEYNI